MAFRRSAPRWQRPTPFADLTYAAVRAPKTPLREGPGLETKEAAYRRADAELVKAWLRPPTNANSHVCSECDGFGSDENSEVDCQACGGTGVVDADYESKTGKAAASRRRDARSVNQIMRDHQANTARIYDDHDRDLTEAWRRS